MSKEIASLICFMAVLGVRASIALPMGNPEVITSRSDWHRANMVCYHASASLMHGYKGPEKVGDTYNVALLNTCLVHVLNDDHYLVSHILPLARQSYRDAKDEKPDLADPESFGAVFDELRKPGSK